jgi:hypothetical protein
MKTTSPKGCIFLPLVFFIFISIGCASTQKRLLDSDISQLQIRSIQTRAFDTIDREMMLRTVMATLQDFGFMLDAGEVALGTVSGTKWMAANLMRITVSVRPRGQTQLLVRANFQLGNKAVKDQVPYQRFFSALSKSLFLEAQQVE